MRIRGAILGDQICALLYEAADPVHFRRYAGIFQIIVPSVRVRGEGRRRELRQIQPDARSRPMPVTHTNRKGDVYYLHEGRTPTGRPKYYCSRELGDAPLEAVPEGFEIWESPEAGLVYVRRIKPAVIVEFEREVVCDGIRRHSRLRHWLVSIEKDSLVVYLPTMDEAELTRRSEATGAASQLVRAARDEIMRRSPYVKMMRFVLADRKERGFCVERWCFSGGIDDWYLLDGPAPLATLVNKYVKHLGRQSFFELM